LLDHHGGHMADNCYNTFTFFGNAKVLKQVGKWEAELKAATSTKHDGSSAKAILEVFFPEIDHQTAITFLGVKWAYPDFGESIPLDAGELGFVCAWSAMEDFQDHLTKVLHKIDKNVVVRLLYNTDSLEEGARYAVIGNDGQILSKEIELQYTDEAREVPTYSLFYEHCLDSCEELVDELPALKAKLMNHMKNLEKVMYDPL